MYVCMCGYMNAWYAKRLWSSSSSSSFYLPTYLPTYLPPALIALVLPQSPCLSCRWLVGPQLSIPPPNHDDIHTYIHTYIPTHLPTSIPTYLPSLLLLSRRGPSLPSPASIFPTSGVALPTFYHTPVCMYVCMYVCACKRERRERGKETYAGHQIGERGEDHANVKGKEHDLSAESGAG